MDYTQLVLTADPQRSLSELNTVLLAVGFEKVSGKAEQIAYEGPGMRSTRQNPLLGASRIELTSERQGFQLAAELGGVRQMQRFLKWFPISLGLGLFLVLGPILGIVFGQAFGVGFGAPFAAGGNWWLLSTLALLPVAPWLVLSPLMGRGIERRSRRALDRLCSSVGELSPKSH